MDNYQIADFFSLLAKLTDIHGENSFKAKSYSSAAFSIEKSDVQLSELTFEQMSSVRGIGASTAQKVQEILKTGHLKALEEIIFKTPPGVVEMMNIKGIGPKKIHTIWKEMEIESVGELLYACKENRLKTYKGFGEKTQQSVIETIEFYLRSKERHLYAQVTKIASQTLAFFSSLFGEKNVQITGEFYRQLEIVDDIDYVIAAERSDIENKLATVTGFTLDNSTENALIYQTSAGIKVRIYHSSEEEFIDTIIATSSSREFKDAFTSRFRDISKVGVRSENEYFERCGLQTIPAFLRENSGILDLAERKGIPEVIQLIDIKGIIHSHSTWSDGSNTIEEMAAAAVEKGLQYLVISDHSKSAFYANGLTEERIRQQHYQIDEINKKLAPFRIFKSIESDILNDGSLDYSTDVLKTFDLVIASVHSNLKMQEDKATARLIAAIENPYTTILGHMTGRLLLSRSGYPVDHEKIFDACVANNVVIELNAHPNRLDIDWRHIQRALEKGLLISIDPDAHFIEGFEDINYGVLVAQKAMVTKERNLSSFDLNQFTEYLNNRRTSKKL